MCVHGANPQALENDEPLNCSKELQKKLEVMLTIKFASLSHLISVSKLTLHNYNSLENCIEQTDRSCSSFIDFFILHDNQKEHMATELDKIIEVIKSQKGGSSNVSKPKRRKKQENQGAALLKTWFNDLKKMAQKVRVSGVIENFFKKALREKNFSFEDFKQKCPKHYEMFENCRFVVTVTILILQLFKFIVCVIFIL